MQSSREQRPAETALIVIVSLLLGLVIGVVGGFFVGRSTAPQIVQPLAEQPVAIISPAPPASATSEVATLIPAVANSTPASSAAPITSTAVTPETTSRAALAATPIPIPQARTATLPPPIRMDVAIADQQATELAEQAIQASPAKRFISAPHVRFTNDLIELSATVDDPTHVLGSGPLLVRAKPIIVSPNVRVQIEEATIAGAQAPQDLLDAVEGVMNDIFRSALADRKVDRVAVAEGMITVTVLQPTQ